MYEVTFGPLVNSTWMYTPRNRRTLLSSPINTPYSLAHFTLNPPLNPLETLREICEFGVSEVEVFEVSLQGGNALKPSSFLCLKCFSLLT
jgi:hypothetical protein